MSCCKFEVSLWDLKQGIAFVFLYAYFYLKYPYGIWNSHLKADDDFSLPIWSIPMGFETRWSHIWSARYIDLKYPYGIWNYGVVDIKNVKSAIWSIPMGFETFSLWKACGAEMIFEVSLWDLKRGTIFSLSRASLYLKYPYGIWNAFCLLSVLDLVCIWSIPMGFETLSLKDYQLSHPIWSIPMGFETIFVKVGSRRWYNLKYPYGIWNSISKRLSTFTSKFEVSLWDLKLYRSRFKSINSKFEVSLWDLKPKIWNQINKILNQFEVSLWDLKLNRLFRKVSDIIFEVSLWDLKQICNYSVNSIYMHLKYPYGIWNKRNSIKWCRSRRKFEVSLWDLKRIKSSHTQKLHTIWSIPMGFETNTEKKSTD